MKQQMVKLAYLVLGWMLGLLSPLILDKIKARRERRELAVAIRAEAEDLQYRLACVSFLLAQHCGAVSRDYLLWLRPKLAKYKGREPVESGSKFVEALLKASEDELLAMVNSMKAEEGVGLSLKLFQASLIESSLARLPKFPADYQSRIHEFRNQLNALSQEIERALERQRMTFDSSLGEQNLQRLRTDVEAKYRFIQGMSVRVADRLQAIIDYDRSRI